MHKWNVTLIHEESGRTVEVEYANAWSIEKNYITPDSIARSCAAETTVKTREKHLPVTAALVDEATPIAA